MSNKLRFSEEDRYAMFDKIKSLKDEIIKESYNIQHLANIFQNSMPIEQEDITHWWQVSEQCKQSFNKHIERINILQLELSDIVRNNLEPFVIQDRN